MTLGSLAVSGSSAAGSFCSCCGAKMMPYFSDNAVVSQNQINQLISESFLTVKGAALFLPRGNGSSPSSVPRITQRRNKHTGDLQQHLQTMFTLLRPEDTIRLAVRLESAYPQCTRYMVIVSTNGRQDTEESIVLGMDFSSSDCSCSVGLVLPLWSDTLIHLDGDGGFSVSTVNRVHVFKPVSVQAMWAALQSLHKACEVARCHNYYPGSLFLTWVSYYQSRVTSDQLCINEWNAMQDVQSHRADSPVLFTDVPTERERTERLIKTRLREIMMQKDLENVTSKEIRTELEMQMVCNLREFKEFIDNEMIVILGQMDSPTEIFDHVYLGSEWNASNLEELQSSGVRYILNVTREIDNFFPGLFEYHNIRVYDEEATNLLEYWNDTYKFISKAKKAGAKCLVHCKMGVSRSASTVIAYAMKEYGWDLERAFEHVKDRRAVTKPNPSFMKQLEEYQGILLASKQRHNKLWRSHSDSDLSERREPPCRTPHTLGRSDPHNNNRTSSPSLQQVLGTAALQALNSKAEVPESEQDRADTLSEPSTLTTTSSASNHALCDSEENLLLSSQKPKQEEDPFLPPRPRPRAATVVPEQSSQRSTLLSVATTVPISGPHPPPLLHLIPTAPSLEPPAENAAVDHCKQSSPSVPERNTDSVELILNALDSSESEDSHQISESTVSKSLELSLDSGSGVGADLASPGIPMVLGPSGLELDLHGNDDNNNPSGTQTELSDSPVSTNPSRLSTDSIDFFSAREKFLGLSQDGLARSLSEPAAPRTPHSRCLSQELQPSSAEDADVVPASEGDQKNCSSQPEDSSDMSSQTVAVSQPHSHDNGVSVRHIVTELESITHTVTPISHHSAQEEEDEDNQEKADSSHTPFMLSTSWPSGSVRRVTKQLELRLKQELEDSQSAGVPSPSRSSLPSPCMDCTQPCSASPPPGGTVDMACNEPENRHGGDTKELHNSNSELDPSFSVYPVSKQPLDSDHVTVSPPQELDPSSTLLWLDGVTELETDTDDPVRPNAQLARSSEDLEKIQETLRELQAFLYEATGLGGHSGTAQGQPPPAVGSEEQQQPELRGPAMWQRAMEIEARIRQAGLTPPSLMKRSASLAKLDCLELSANDLNDWDFHAPSPSPGPQQPVAASSSLPSTSHSHCPDDAHKKQRILPQSRSSPDPPAPRLEPVRTEGSAHQHRLSSGSVSLEQSHCQPVVTVTTTRQQQHAKPHPARRLRRAADKKKTVTVLYNTM
ncbi:protein phosphatase Slingshot homolog 2 [Chanos chanos]|uniref:protein-serine/threonine phosphatase n=1 Tax=Chanos chanos TaxID=29144 RepID=A0A6J2VLZ0_CHACN|nr:protein phosphatase Slingshot homolog 2 [Chanos chanos]